MPGVTKFQLGMTSESTWNSASTVTRFFEIIEESVTPEYRRVEVPGLRAGARAMRADRSVPYFFGAGGSFKLSPLTKGFGAWIEHMLGDVSVSGPSSLLYTHRGTCGTLTGKGFTWQVNRATHPGDVDSPYTYTGGKVGKWSITAKAGEALEVELECMFRGESTAISLASASYPSGTDVEGLTFIGADLQIASSSTTVSADSFKVEVDNKLDRGNYLRSSPAGKEPVQEGLVEVTWEIEGDYVDSTHRDRVASAVASSNIASIVATFRGQIANASSSYPSLLVLLPAARFDEGTPNITGPEPLHYKLSGKGLIAADLSGPIALEYATSDATP